MPTDKIKKVNIDADSVWLLLSLYADDEATPAERLEFEKLLQDNPELGQRLAMVRVMSALAANYAPVAPPENFTSTICQRLTAEAVKQSVTEDDRWELLSRYADGEALPNERLLVQAKLDADPVWQEELNIIHAAGLAMRSMRAPEPPAALTSGIKSALLEQQRRKSALGRAVLYVRTAASVAAAALLVGYVATRGNHVVGTGSEGPVNKGVVRVEPLPAPGLGIPDGLQAKPEAANDSVESGTRTRTGVAVERLRVAPPADAVHVSLASMHSASNSSRNLSAARFVSKDAASARNAQDADTADTGDIEPSATVTPGMDRQNQRPPVVAESAPLLLADSVEPVSPASAASEMEPPKVSPAVNSVTSAAGSPVITPSTEAAPRRHTASLARALGTHLTALPPDANQVLTRADLARNRAAALSGYDKLSLRNMEHKEASVFFLRGSF
jgi:anti-sigma factor RsiW